MTNKKVVKKIREQLILSDVEKDTWVKSYETSGKLPSINIPCSKCHTGVTAAHENLRSKVTKYKGIKNLLDSFICKSCTTVVPKAFKLPVKRKRKSKISTLDSNNIIKQEDGRYNIPLMNVNPERYVYSISDIASNASLTEEFTLGVCLSPQLYLNNDNTCDKCPLFNNCACGVKQLSKARRKQLAVEA